jgi:hypothetical protein
MTEDVPRRRGRPKGSKTQGKKQVHGFQNPDHPMHKPASGVPASNTPATGMGWGGPSRNVEPMERRGKPGPNGKKELLRKLLEEHAEKAVARIAAVMEDKTNPRSLVAAQDILNRVMGMPTQEVRNENVQLGPDGEPIAPGATFILQIDRG